MLSRYWLRNRIIDKYIEQSPFERGRCMSSVISSSCSWAVRDLNYVYCTLECVYPMGEAVSLSCKCRFYVKIFIMRFLLRRYTGEACKLGQSWWHWFFIRLHRETVSWEVVVLHLGFLILNRISSCGIWSSHSEGYENLYFLGNKAVEGWYK